MSVNVRLKLPVGTEIRQVADVCGLLLGNKSESKGKWIKVDGVKLSNAYTVGLAEIQINLNSENPVARIIAKSDGYVYSITYHFESESHYGPLLMPKATSAKIALCKGLVDFFGGTLDVNDSDDVEKDIVRRPKGFTKLFSGERFGAFQKSLASVKPLTQRDIDYWESKASY